MVFGNFPRGCRVEYLFDIMGKLYLYMRKHKNPWIQMLFTTQTYRTQKTHFNGVRDLFDTNKKNYVLFLETHKMGTHKCYLLEYQSLWKSWPKDGGDKEKEKEKNKEEKLIVFWIARESSVSDAFSKFLSKYSYISLRRLCNFH